MSIPSGRTVGPELTGTHVITVLARVQAFLPQIQVANQLVESVARENPSSVDIESFNGTEQSYIQLVSLSQA